MSPAKPRGPRVLFQHQLKKKRKRRKTPAMSLTPLTLSDIVAWAERGKVKEQRGAHPDQIVRGATPFPSSTASRKRLGSGGTGSAR